MSCTETERAQVHGGNIHVCAGCEDERESGDCVGEDAWCCGVRASPQRARARADGSSRGFQTLAFPDPDAASMLPGVMDIMIVVERGNMLKAYSIIVTVAVCYVVCNHCVCVRLDLQGTRQG